MKITITLFAAVLIAFTINVSAQGRGPSMAVRPYIVKTGESLDALEKTMKGANKVEELSGGPGGQLRVAVQHDDLRENTEGELHDESDDVYYVTEGSARLTLGGKLENAREISHGEWRAKDIVGGKSFDIKKGDLIIVPRGTPHQRNSIKGKHFTMILIKIYKDPLPAK